MANTSRKPGSGKKIHKDWCAWSAGVPMLTAIVLGVMALDDAISLIVRP
jgi:hypothetical protein